MKLFGILISAAALPRLVAATESKGGDHCLSDADARLIVERSSLYLSHSNNKTAKAAGQSLYSKSIVEYNQSVNSLLGEPIGSIIESNKQHYIKDTLSTAPLQVQTLDIVHNCSKVVWHWLFTGVGSGEYPVAGFTLLYVDTNTGKVDTEYVEFNSLAWAADIGFNITALVGLKK